MAESRSSSSLVPRHTSRPYAVSTHSCDAFRRRVQGSVRLMFDVAG